MNRILTLLKEGKKNEENGEKYKIDNGRTDGRMMMMDQPSLATKASEFDRRIQ
jgi:hypothetical protein